MLADRAALVEPLRERHRLAHREAERARRGLLQLRRREGRRRVLCAARAPRPRRRAARSPRRARAPPRPPRAVASRGSLPSNLSFSPRQTTTRAGKADAVLRERHRHGEVGDRDEALALGLALDDDPQRDRLDAPGREPAPDLVPEQLRDLVADQAVDDAAGLLRADPVLSRSRRGFSIARVTAVFVISLNSARWKRGLRRLLLRAARAGASRSPRPRGRGRRRGRRARPSARASSARRPSSPCRARSGSRARSPSAAVDGDALLRSRSRTWP